MASSGVSEDYDCTERCRSVEHGRIICDIACKGTDKEVLSLWKQTCLRFYKVKDEFGRSAIHMAASTGREKVVEWLVKKEGVDVNSKDLMSGYTPLHRSIFFGHLNVARTLIRLNAPLQVSDYEGFHPLDLFLVNKPKFYDNLSTVPNEVYVWGSNENYNLGIGTQQPRIVPELMDRAKRLPFEYVGSCITQVCMERYHSLFVHLTGDVYSCGYGAGGKLGLGNEFSAFSPGKIDLGHDQCVKVALGPDHSLFLLATGEVRSCGSNENAVLGHKNNMSKVCKPKRVDIPPNIVDVAASRLHSVFLSKGAIYICGSNVGQMCKPADCARILKPEKVSLPYDVHSRTDQVDEFKAVACTDNATAITHTGGLIYLMKNYDCIILNARNVGISKIQLIENKPLSSTGERLPIYDNENSANKGKLTLFALTNTGRLLIWREPSGNESVNASKPSKQTSSALFNFIVFNVGRSLTLRDFAASSESVVLINSLGEAFKANVSNSPLCIPSIGNASNSVSSTKSGSSKTSSSKAVDTWNYVVQQSTRRATGKDPFSNMMLEILKVKRVPNIHSGIAAFCDPRGKNFAITQIHQKANLVVLPTALQSEIQSDFETLLCESSVEDNVHDVVFKVKEERFPAHQFVIAYSCKVLYDKIRGCENQGEDVINVTVADVDPIVFRLILQFIYTNTCDVFSSQKLNYVLDKLDLENLKIYARKLNLQDLQKKLKLVEYSDNKLSYTGKIGSGRKFKVNSFKELHDVELVSDDGKSVGAHLCVIVARLEYFKNMMFSNFWMEGSRRLRRLNFPGTGPVMDIFLQLVYEDTFTLHRSGSKKDLEILSQALVSTDLLLAQQFRSQLECAIVDCLNVDNVSDVIQLAEVCNANQLKESCMEFTCLNIAVLLENRGLDGIPSELMSEISDYYRRHFASISGRRLKSESGPASASYAQAVSRFGHLFDGLDEVEGAEYCIAKKAKNYRLKMKINTNASSGSTNDTIEESGQELLLSPERNYESHSVVRERYASETECPPEQLTEPKQPRDGNNIRSTSSPIAIHQTSTPKSKMFGPVLLKESEFPSFEDSVTSEITKTQGVKASPHSPTSKISSMFLQNAQNMGKRKTKWVRLNDDTVEEKVSDIKLPESSSPASNNPWQRMLATSPNEKSIITNGSKIVFDDIVLNEQKKKDNLQKALEKSIQCSQVEEAAMNELRKKYCSPEVLQGIELVEVSLSSVENEYAIPVWRKLNANPLDT